MEELSKYRAVARWFQLATPRRAAREFAPGVGELSAAARYPVLAWNAAASATDARCIATLPQRFPFSRHLAAAENLSARSGD
jgi:hypothetical protein